jgi:glutamate 5-kinase
MTNRRIPMMTERVAIPVGVPVVVKVGSSSLSKRDGGVDLLSIARTVQQVCSLWDRGNPTVLVSSGAVAAGIADFNGRPTEITDLQVAAAVGQSRLMEHYSRAFANEGRTVGQVLLTKDVLGMRSQYLHARAALDRMLEMGIVPIVNENDTVAVEELKLGDNDRLAAIVSHLVGAKLLVLLTDTKGLYADDPRFNDDPQLLSAVRHNDQILDELAKGGAGPLGSGGVATKVAAARMAAWSGVPTVIASAKLEDAPLQAVSGEVVGTWVAPHEAKLSSRKLWIAFGMASQGTVTVDGGAARAIVERGSSLLAVGATSVTGDFPTGAAVEIRDEAGATLAKGTIDVGSGVARASLGKRSDALHDWDGQLVHRDNLVVLAT